MIKEIVHIVQVCQRRATTIYPSKLSAMQLKNTERLCKGTHTGSIGAWHLW